MIQPYFADSSWSGFVRAREVLCRLVQTKVDLCRPGIDLGYAKTPRKGKQIYCAF